MSYFPHAALAAALAVAATGPASAQASAPKAEAYRSAFEGYRRFGDQKVQPWRDANDTVGRIGGWQAYAREAAASEADPKPGAAQAPPASTPNGTHPGHGGHSMHKKP